MDEILHTTNMYFTRMDRKLDIIIDYIKSNPSANVKPPTLDSNFLGLFPLNDLESLINFNESLKNDDENLTKLVKSIILFYSI